MIVVYCFNFVEVPCWWISLYIWNVVLNWFPADYVPDHELCSGYTILYLCQTKCHANPQMLTHEYITKSLVVLSCQFLLYQTNWEHNIQFQMSVLQLAYIILPFPDWIQVKFWVWFHHAYLNFEGSALIHRLSCKSKWRSVHSTTGSPQVYAISNWIGSVHAMRMVRMYNILMWKNFPVHFLFKQGGKSSHLHKNPLPPPPKKKKNRHAKFQRILNDFA